VSTPSPVSPRHVQAAIIGTGQAGPSLAVALGKRGESVAIFEGHQVGGTCVNTGCTPTKTLRKSARVANLARRAGDFGIEVGTVTVDFAAVMARMHAMTGASRQQLTEWMSGAENVTLVRDWARLDGRHGGGEGGGESERDGGPFVLRAGAHTFHADRVYLNVGTSAVMPPITGLAESGAMVNDALLALRELPAHLIVLGGSYIGLELGQIFRRLGSAVTILETSPHIVTREDAEVRDGLDAMLREEGVEICTNVAVQRVSGQCGREVVVEFTVAAAPGAASEPNTGPTMRTVRGTHLLVATGRRPNTATLGLETVGVSCDAHGYVPVNGGLETNVPGVFALGDVNRRGAFTHTSYQDYQIVLANHTGGARTVDGRVSTYALYTDPPLGRVGLNESEARTLMGTGRRFLQATHEMRHVSRAKEESETVGIIKVLVDADTERFVGATVFGIGGDEIVQVLSAQMAADAPYRVLRDFLPVHPTVTEFFPTILGKLAPLV
jgi:pyruvate/2-oxoglutarate dehydrogenase complex dihydrolipoamide dehydrogenase (E3) component